MEDKLLNKEVLDILSKVKKDSSSETEDAVKMLDLTNQIMESIMQGRQLDLAFYDLYSKNVVANVRKKKKKA